MKNAKMIIMTVLAVMGMVISLNANDRKDEQHYRYDRNTEYGSYRDNYRDRGYGHNSYRDHNSYGKYDRKHDREMFRRQAKLMKEIRKNEIKIDRLQDKIREMQYKMHNCRASRYRYYSSRIDSMRWEISRLRERNRHLRHMY